MMENHSPMGRHHHLHNLHHHQMGGRALSPVTSMGGLHLDLDEGGDHRGNHSSGGELRKSAMSADIEEQLREMATTDPTMAAAFQPLLCRLNNGALSPRTRMEQEKRLRREIANSNERRRMQSINAGFQSLKSLLPKRDGEKMSKAAILQHSVQFIRRLQGEKNQLIQQNYQYKQLVELSSVASRLSVAAAANNNATANSLAPPPVGCGLAPQAGLSQPPHSAGSGASLSMLPSVIPQSSSVMSSLVPSIHAGTNRNPSAMLAQPLLNHQFNIHESQHGNQQPQLRQHQQQVSMPEDIGGLKGGMSVKEENVGSTLVPMDPARRDSGISLGDRSESQVKREIEPPRQLSADLPTPPSTCGPNHRRSSAPATGTPASDAYPIMFNTFSLGCGSVTSSISSSSTGSASPPAIPQIPMSTSSCDITCTGVTPASFGSNPERIVDDSMATAPLKDCDGTGKSNGFTTEVPGADSGSDVMCEEEGGGETAVDAEVEQSGRRGSASVTTSVQPGSDMTMAPPKKRKKYDHISNDYQDEGIYVNSDGSESDSATKSDQSLTASPDTATPPSLHSNSPSNQMPQSVQSSVFFSQAPPPVCGINTATSNNTTVNCASNSIAASLSVSSVTGAPVIPKVHRPTPTNPTMMMNALMGTGLGAQTPEVVTAKSIWELEILKRELHELRSALGQERQARQSLEDHFVQALPSATQSPVAPAMGQLNHRLGQSIPSLNSSMASASTAAAVAAYSSLLDSYQSLAAVNGVGMLQGISRPLPGNHINPRACSSLPQSSSYGGGVGLNPEPGLMPRSMAPILTSAGSSFHHTSQLQQHRHPQQHEFPPRGLNLNTPQQPLGVLPPSHQGVAGSFGLPIGLGRAGGVVPSSMSRMPTVSISSLASSVLHSASLGMAGGLASDNFALPGNVSNLLGPNSGQPSSVFSGPRRLSLPLQLSASRGPVGDADCAQKPNLEAIVEAIRQLEGDSLFVDTAAASAAKLNPQQSLGGSHSAGILPSAPFQSLGNMGGPSMMDLSSVLCRKPTTSGLLTTVTPHFGMTSSDPHVPRQNLVTSLGYSDPASVAASLSTPSVAIASAEDPLMPKESPMLSVKQQLTIATGTPSPCAKGHAAGNNPHQAVTPPKTVPESSITGGSEGALSFISPSSDKPLVVIEP